MKTLADLAVLLSTQLDTDVIAPADAGEMLDDAQVAVNAAQTVLDRLGLRVASGGAARKRGFENDADWFGNVTQTDPRRAGRRLLTARILSDVDDSIANAWKRGEFSSEQADLIADGLRAPAPEPEPAPLPDPDAEHNKAAALVAERKRQAELFEAAKKKRLTDLRKQAALNAANNKNKFEEGRAARYFWFRDVGNGTKGGFFLAPGEGAMLQSLFDAAFPEVREQHKAISKESGLPIDWGHVRADTFAAMLARAQGSSGGSSRSSVVTYNVDVKVDESGSINWPDVWLMNGTVAMPSAVADSLASDPMLRYLFSINGKLVGIGQDSPDISNAVKKAVLARSGGTCENPQCNKPGREFHHQQERYRGGVGTDPNNIYYLCWPDHQLITYDGFMLAGPPDDLVWLLPGEDPPERLAQWMAEYEAKCTAPKKVFKTRDFRPGEKPRRERVANARAQTTRDARTRVEEDVGDFDSGGSVNPRERGPDPLSANDEDQETLF